MPTPETRIVCSKCGRTEEISKALKDGWLHAQRKGKPQGHLIIRCPEHITEYAKKQAA